MSVSKTYRCPVDDVVFEGEGAPHHSEGHPECPGPVCRQKYAKKNSDQQQEHASLD